MARFRHTEPELMSASDKFWSFVSKSDGCWAWTGTIDAYGYGKIRPLGGRDRFVFAHRLSYFYATGDDPGDLFVCHACDNPACVNPDHLFLGTSKDNTDDRIKKGRRIVPPNLVIPDADVPGIIDEVAGGPRGTTARIARRYGVHPSAISHITAGRRRAHV